ncbi:mitochondrial carrier homolog 2-like [Amia ocellicauda]|uniref:mitochondrial carrier homolog 2-like n=1 Tax=Amia ocellicauda TaxID=2972642 RepID=UPI0034645368
MAFLLTVISHPAVYTTLLVQVGYEPLTPTLGRNIFGRQVYYLPGLFTYAKYIVKIDGISGLFKGLVPRLCALAIGKFVYHRVIQRFSEEDRYKTAREMVARSCSLIVGHPFHVIALRCMVQFIGRETKYNRVFNSILTIYKEEGIMGFFAGLIPRLLGDIFSVWICKTPSPFINYAIFKRMNHMGEIKNCFQAGFESILTYPFVLVSNVMAVNNCGLAGGLPPYAPVYHTWEDCWRHLSGEGNISRGNSLFFREVPTWKTYSVEQKRVFLN